MNSTINRINSILNSNLGLFLNKDAMAAYLSERFFVRNKGNSVQVVYISNSLDNKTTVFGNTEIKDSFP